ncbi:MAG: lysylphosphatidylglycerol synthase transmembrane domain-containing protein [Phycisphaerales bacterium JB063]
MATDPTQTAPRQDDGHPADGVAAPTHSRRKRLLFVLKLVITVALLGWIIAAVDWVDVGQRLAEMSWVVLAVVLLIWTVCVIGSAMKWQQLLAVHGAPYRLWLLTRWYFIAFFLSQFLPSVIGGDGYRVYKTLDNPAGKTSAVLAIFVERATGMLALLALGWVAAVVLLYQTGDEVARWLVYFGGGSAAAGIISAAVMMRFKLLGKIARHRRCPGKVRVLIERAWEYREHPWRVLYVALLSFLFHGSRAGLYYLLFWAIAEPQGLMELTVVMAVTTVVSLIPISLNGYGLVDGSFIYLMHQYGATEESALAVMVLIRVTTIPVALLGGVFYFADSGGRTPRKQEATLTLQAEA